MHLEAESRMVDNKNLSNELAKKKNENENLKTEVTQNRKDI